MHFKQTASKESCISLEVMNQTDSNWVYYQVRSINKLRTHNEWLKMNSKVVSIKRLDYLLKSLIKLPHDMLL